MKVSFLAYWDNLKEHRLAGQDLASLVVRRRRRSIGVGHLKYKTENGYLVAHRYNQPRKKAQD